MGERKLEATGGNFVCDIQMHDLETDRVPSSQPLSRLKFATVHVALFYTVAP